MIIKVRNNASDVIVFGDYTDIKDAVQVNKDILRSASLGNADLECADLARRLFALRLSG